MYLYKRAVGINRDIPRGEEPLDISTLNTNVLLTKFDRLKLVLLDQIANLEVVLIPSEYKNELNSFNGTIQDWLDANPNVQLNTSNRVPSDELIYVTTHDIQYEGFSLKPGDVTLADDYQDQVTVSSGDEIRVVKTDRTNFDYEKLLNKTLWTINGHLVRGVFGNEAIFLLNAGKHFRVNDNIHVNCLNFNNLCDVETHSVKPTDIRATKTDDLVTIHYKSGISLRDKTVWFSIGGRLFGSEFLTVRSDNSIAFKTDRIDWFSNIFDSKELIDLSNVIDKDRDVVGSDFFSTEEFLVNLFTDPSSFLILLDNPNIFVEAVPITTYSYPFTYETSELRQLPLVTHNGLLPKYNTRKLGNRRLLDIDLGVQKKYLNKTSGVGNLGNLFHSFTNRVRPSSLSRGHLLYIRGLIREY